MRQAFIILSFLVFVGCKESGKRDIASIDTILRKKAKADSFPKMETPIKEEEALREKAWRTEALLDSLRLAKVLRSAMVYAEKNKSRSAFQHEFVMLPDDTSYNVITEMNYGHLFTFDKKHLLLKRKFANELLCDIFLLQNGHFKEVTKEPLSVFMQIDDTLRDVNGDGYKDFLVHWYPSSGCCRRNTYEVLLYQSRTGGFTKPYSFINPTFFPKEKVIRGVEYGHPEEVGLYKYKWSGLRTDKIEFIYPHPTDENKFIKTKRPIYKPTEKDGIVLTSLPKEYRKIESIDWFSGY